MKPFKSMDILRKLPLEVSQEIVKYLTTKELCQIAIYIPEWTDIVKNRNIWFERCKRYGYVEVDESKRSIIYKAVLLAYPDVDLQGVYIYNEAVFQNWKFQNSVVKRIRTTRMIYFLHYFDDEILIFGTVTEKIIVYNYNTKRIINKFQVHGRHSMEIGKVIKYQNLLICFGCSQNLWVWNLDTGTSLILPKRGRIKTLVAHQHLIVFILEQFKDCQVYNMISKKVEYTSDKYVNCICFGNDILALGEIHGSIDIVNLNYEVVTKLKCSQMRCVDGITIMDDNLISFCVCQGLNVCLWNIKSRTLLHTIHHSSHSVYPMFINKNTFLLPKNDHSLDVMDFSTGAVRCVLENYSDIGHVLMNSYLILVVTNSPPKIMAWSSKTYKFVTMFYLQMKRSRLYNAPQVTNTKLIYTSADGEKPSYNFTLLDFEAKIEML